MCRRHIPFLSYCFCLLIVSCFNLEVSLSVVANRADARSLFSNYNVSTVRALPDAVSVLREYHLVLNVFQKLAVALFVMFLNFSYAFEFSSNLVKSFFTSFFCHTGIHICPFEVLTSSSISKVSFCSVDFVSVQIFIP